MDGNTVADIQQNGTTGIENINNVYRFRIPQDAQGNNSCRIIARVRSDGQADSRGNVELIPISQ